MTPFQAAAAAASAAVDATYGETWTYLPMAAGDPNGRKSADPDRAAVDIIGTYFGPFARAMSGPARQQGVKPEQPGHASDRPVCDIAETQLPFRPRRSDQLLRTATGIRYGIAEVRPDGTGRIALDLNLLSQPQTPSTGPQLDFSRAPNSQFVPEVF